MRTVPTTHRRRLRLVAAGLALGLAAAACGGEGDIAGDAPDLGGDGGDDAADGGGADADGTDADDGPDATGDELLAQLQDAGSITVGIANEVPYGYQGEDGEITGEAIEVARAVLPGIGIDDIEAQVVEFNALISGLQAGQFDMIAAGMYIDEDRAQQILFSDPDYCVGEAFAVPEGNPLGISDLESVVEGGEATIAILSGAVEEGYAEDAGLPAEQIELFTDVNAQYDALAAGRVDAVIGTSLTVLTQVEGRDGFEATESFFPLDEDGEEILGCGGFGFRNEDQELRDAFNDELNRLQDEGEILPIIEAFGFAREDIERAESLTVEDLAG